MIININKGVEIIMGKITGWTKNNLFGITNWWDSQISQTSMIYVVEDQNRSSPKLGMWVVGISSNSRKLPKKYFKTKQQAMTYATRYMRAHPRG